MRKPSYSNSRGFTLIELLTVVAIIGILAGLLLPAINAARKKAKITQAQTEIHSIETAWKAYFNEYGKWPVDGNTMYLGIYAAGEYSMLPPATLPPSNTDWIPAGPETAALLLGSQTNYVVGVRGYVAASDNPKGIQFINLKVDPKTGGFSDPWGNPYYFLFDVDYDNSINPVNTALGVPAGTPAPATVTPIPRTVIVW